MANLKFVLAVMMVAACGARPPTDELLRARKAYSQAEGSSAKELAPDRLLTARQALDRAEEAHEEEPRSKEEVTRAYIAERKAYLAISWAGLRAARTAYEEARSGYTAELETRQRLSNKELDAARNDLSQVQEQLDKERQAREAAEAKATEAMQKVEEVAKVKQDGRGFVMTVESALLFNGKTTNLLPSARDQLSKVAEVVLSKGKGKKILIEGHTDSQGSDGANKKMTQKRADAIRMYLVGRGVPAATIKATGLGETEPLADNRTAEGRASNRRIEVVIGGE